MIISLMLGRAFGRSSEQIISDTDEFSFPSMKEGKVVQEGYGIVVGPSYMLSFGGTVLSHHP